MLPSKASITLRILLLFTNIHSPGLSKLFRNKSNASNELGDGLVLVDRDILGDLIAEIEDKLDELEAITDPDFMEELYMRVDEIEGGEVAGLNEAEIFDLLKG